MGKLNIELNERFKEIRLLLKLSQKKLALLLNISQGTVSKIENGALDLGLEIIVDLCELSNLTVNEFLKIGKNKDLTPELISLLREAKKLNHYQLTCLIEFIKSIEN